MKACLLACLFCLCPAASALSGEFVKKVLGHDEEGNPIYQYVYQAGNSRFASPRAARRHHVPYGYGYAYHYPRRHFIHVVPRRHPHIHRTHKTTTRSPSTTSSRGRGR